MKGTTPNGIRCFTLQNGLRVVTERIPGRAVCLGLWIRNGSVNELSGEEGSAHFLEHMLFKGTENLSARQISVEMDRLGGQVNAFTEKECTCYYARVLPEHFSRALNLLGDMVQHPLIAPAEFKTERGVILEEIAMCLDDPEDASDDLMNAAFFEEDALGRPILGTAKDIRKLKRQAVAAHHARRYRPENAVLSVSGALPSESEMLDAAETCFSGWKKGEKTAVSLGNLKYRPKVCIKKRKIEQTHVRIAVPGPSMGDERRVVAWVLSALLGEGNASVLYQHIRDELGAAYNVYSETIPYRQSGLFSIYYAASHANAGMVMDTIRKDIQRLANAGISEEGLALAKEQMRIAFTLDADNPMDRMFANGRSLTFLDSCRTADQTLEELRSVNREQACVMLRDMFSIPATVAAITGMQAQFQAVAEPILP